MTKSTKNIFEYGKQTNLLVHGAKIAVQTFQTTVDTSNSDSKVCITCQSYISYFYLATYVSQTKQSDYLNKKLFHIQQKLNQKKKNKQENSKNDKVQQEEILMIPSFTQFNNCIIINMLSLLFKVQKGDSEIKYL